MGKQRRLRGNEYSNGAHSRGSRRRVPRPPEGLAAPEVQADEELKPSATKELASAREQLEKAIKRGYQHVVYLAQPDPDGERYQIS